MAEPYSLTKIHDQHHESLEDRVALLIVEHTHPTGDGSTYFGHTRQSPPISYQGKEVEEILDIQHSENISAPITEEGSQLKVSYKVDWTPKDIKGLRKEVERLNANYEALKNTVLEHLKGLDKKKKYKYSS